MNNIWNDEAELLMGTVFGFVSSTSAALWCDLAGRENHDVTGGMNWVFAPWVNKIT